MLVSLSSTQPISQTANFSKKITLNLDVTSLVDQALLFMDVTDFGYHTFIVANEKFLSVFVWAFRKADVPGNHIGKYGCRQENCHATVSLILRCSH